MAAIEQVPAWPLPILFQMFETRVHDLFDPEELGAEKVSRVADLAAQIGTQTLDSLIGIVDPPIGIAQPAIIDEDADEHRERGYADRQKRLSAARHTWIVAR